VTTGTKTEELEKALDEARAKAGDDGSRIDPPPIDLLASEELSLFVIEHAPGLLFRM